MAHWETKNWVYLKQNPSPISNSPMFTTTTCLGSVFFVGSGIACTKSGGRFTGATRSPTLTMRRNSATLPPTKHKVCPTKLNSPSSRGKYPGGDTAIFTCVQYLGATTYSAIPKWPILPVQWNTLASTQKWHFSVDTLGGATVGFLVSIYCSLAHWQLGDICRLHQLNTTKDEKVNYRERKLAHACYATSGAQQQSSRGAVEAQ